MNLQKIDIEKFRCFWTFHTDVAPKVTIFIGKNGSGKTSLMSGITKALSFIFTNSKKVSDHFLSSGNNALWVNSFGKADFYYNFEKRQTEDSASVKGNARIGDQELNWELYKSATKNASLYASRYKEAYTKFMSVIDGSDRWPLLANYSDSYPHRLSYPRADVMNEMLKVKVQRNYGYYLWDDDAACLSVWDSRLQHMMVRRTTIKEQINREEREQHPNKEFLLKLKKQLEPISEEIDFVEKRLRGFSEDAVDEDGAFKVEYLYPQGTGKTAATYIHLSDGTDRTFDNLPAGYRRLYSIVVDMACRSFLLNGNKEPYGVVLIDEVDLHLHPSLELKVVRCLQNTFPNVQFILTTHSPLVVSNLDTVTQCVRNGQEEPENAVYFIRPGAERTISLNNIFGLDYNSSLENAMEVPSFNPKVEHLIQMCVTYTLQGDDERKNQTWNELKQLVGKGISQVAKEIQLRLWKAED